MGTAIGLLAPCRCSIAALFLFIGVGEAFSARGPLLRSPDAIASGGEVLWSKRIPPLWRRPQSFSKLTIDGRERKGAGAGADAHADVVTQVVARMPVAASVPTGSSAQLLAKEQTLSEGLSQTMGFKTTAEATGWVVEDVDQLRKELLTLEDRRQVVLSGFGEKSLELDALFTQAQEALQKTRHDLHILGEVCGALSSCSECAGAPVCGWCRVEATCVPGDRLGAFAGEELLCPTYNFGSCGLR